MDLSIFFRGNIFIFLYLLYIGNEKMFKSFTYFYVPFLNGAALSLGAYKIRKHALWLPLKGKEPCKKGTKKPLMNSKSKKSEIQLGSNWEWL